MGEKKIRLVFCLAAFFLALLSPSGVFAQENATPQVYIRGISVDDIEQGAVSGSFDIVNESGARVRNLRSVLFSFGLKERENAPSLFVLYEQHKGTENIELDPGEEKRVPFSFLSGFPAVQGSRIGVSLLDQSYTLIAQADARIEALGSGILIELDPSAKLRVGERQAERHEGIRISADSNPQLLSLRVRAKNLSNEPRLVVPRIETYERNFPNAVVSRFEDKVYDFGPGEEKDLVLFPQDSRVARPGSFVAHVSLVDAGDTSIQRSSILDLRYVIQGVGATVLNASFDRESYEPGERGTMSVALVGPADFTVIDAFLYAEITDQRGFPIARIGENVALGPTAVEREFSFVNDQSESIYPRARISVEYEGKVLAEHETGRISDEAPVFAFLLISLALLVILLGGGIAFFVNKRKGRAKVT